MTALQNFSRELDASRKILKKNQSEPGDLTQEFSILPDPQFFKDRIHADAEDHAEKIREVIVKQILQSKDGQLDLDLNFMHGKEKLQLNIPVMWKKHITKSLRTWAEMAGYKIEFMPGRSNFTITRLKIFPKDSEEKKKRNWHMWYWLMRVLPITLGTSMLGWATWGVYNAAFQGGSPGHIVVPVLFGTLATIGTFAFCYDEADIHRDRLKKLGMWS